MKKILLACSFGVASLSLMTSCNSQNSAIIKNTSIREISLYKLKGKWQISSIIYDDKKFKIKPFDEGVDIKCFEKSIWKLVPNNDSGSYTVIGNDNCPSITQNIIFEITKNEEFRFKKLIQNVKAKNIIDGYVLQLENHQENSFTLIQSIPFEGEILKVYYNFEKLSSSTK